MAGKRIRFAKSGGGHIKDIIIGVTKKNNVKRANNDIKLQ